MYEGVLDVLGSDEGFSLGSVGEGRGERGGGVKCGGGGGGGGRGEGRFTYLELSEVGFFTWPGSSYSKIPLTRAFPRAHII